MAREMFTYISDYTVQFSGPEMIKGFRANALYGIDNVHLAGL